MRFLNFHVVLSVAVIFICGCKEHLVSVSNVQINAGRKIITGQQPVVSPDGTRILFGDGWGNVFICDSSGGNQRQLNTSAGDIALGTVSWSPNGKEFAYFSLMTNGTDGQSYMRLRSFIIDSKSYRELSPNDSIAYPHNIDTPIIWSPAGDKVAYFENSHPTTSVNIIKSDGSGIVLNNFISRAFAWSPDGTQFACTYGYPDSAHLYIGSVGAGSFEKLTPNAFTTDAYLLAFSSHLSWLVGVNAFTFYAFNGLVHFDVNTRIPTYVFTHLEKYPAVSPDGTRIAYVEQVSYGSADTSPIVELRCVGNATPLATLCQVGLSFIWSPNSKDLYLQSYPSIYKIRVE